MQTFAGLDQEAQLFQANGSHLRLTTFSAAVAKFTL
jgi:hypothetical protein